jgi:predicted SnoaL-like aldol condensation-catalyzing enzyme
LASYDQSKVDQYFTDDAVIIINEKILSGKKEIAARLNWIRENKPEVKVVLKRAFFNGDVGFDHHLSIFTGETGQQSIFKIFGYIEMRGDKISRYEDVTIQIEGEPEIKAATSTI